MSNHLVLQKLKTAGIVPVMRGVKKATINEIVEAFLAADIQVIEITIESEEGLAAIQQVKQTFGNTVLVGAGTVLTVQDAQKAIDVGVDFIVTPIFNKEVIKTATEHHVFIASGAFTPTEAYEAYSAGANLIKIFPAGVLGPAYVKDLQGPLGFIPIMPTGGVNEKNIQSYIQAGAVCVGVGSAIYKFETTEEITEAARRYKKLVTQA